MPGLRYALPLIGAVLAAPAAMAQTSATQTAATPAAPAAMAQTAATPAAPPAPEPTPAAAAAAPAPAAAAPACELHVWPAARVSAMTQGAGASMGLIGALVDASAHADQNKRDTAFITGTLDAHAQAQVLRDLDLPAKLHLPPSQVIFHEQGIDVNRDDPKRLSDSTVPCYAEFVVRGLFYFKSVAYRGQMRTFFELRRFDGATVKVDFRDSKHEDLTVKLPKEGEDTGPATDALLAAFKGDAAFFSDKFARKFK